MSQGLDGVRQAAKKDKRLRFTALLHHITEALLRASFYSLKRGAAAGVDQVTWQEYEQSLEERLGDLHHRVHRGSYRAQPVRRVYVQKPDGRQRPLGVVALEDKIVQQAVATVLQAIYEQDFVGFSYGFRPHKSAHDALDALTAGIVRKKVNWILDADIRGFFDNIDHEKLMRWIEQRVADPRMLRLTRKWIKAGVSEGGQRSETKVGTPQGAVISPLLANIYLHYVLDRWVQQWRRRKAKGDLIIVRYADDFVLGFESRDDAERFHEQLAERLGEYGLELSAEKTRLIEFGRYAAERHGLEERTVPGEAQDGAEADGGEAASDWGRAASADARAERGTGRLAPTGGGGILQLPRGAGQPAGAALVSTGGRAALAARAAAAQPAELSALGGFPAVVAAVCALAQCASWLSYGAICGHLSEIGAVCGKAARTDLCGGRRATVVPTATRVSILRDSGWQTTEQPLRAAGLRTEESVLGKAGALRHDRQGRQGWRLRLHRRGRGRIDEGFCV